MHKYNWLEKKSINQVRQKDLAFWDFLSKEAYPVTHGEVRIPISIEPFIIKEKKYNNFYESLQLFVSAAKKIANQYFFDEEIRKIIVINEQEKSLIEESAQEDFVGIIRPDLFWADSPKLVELNADFPDGFFMHDVTATAMAGNLKGKKLISADHDKLFSQLLEEQELDKNSHIFIGYNKDRFFVDEFYLTGLKLRGLGWKNISVGAFEDLSYRGKKFYYDNRPIDSIRRGAELFKLRRIPGFIEKLIVSQKAGQVKIINNFKNRLLGHKSLLAALWDERFYKYLETVEIKAIKELLPKTIKLDKDNLSWVKKNKDTLVLKPADLAEGEGIAVGCSLNKKDWNQALDSAMNNFAIWIVQEKITIPEENFSLVQKQDGKLITARKKYDFDPHLIMFKDRVEIGRILVRFSDSSILNVMQGGGLTYAFIEKEKQKVLPGRFR
jgi:hypothetical protein